MLAGLLALELGNKRSLHLPTFFSASQFLLDGGLKLNQALTGKPLDLDRDWNFAFTRRSLND
jgi:hypothetical protein